jgi:folate-binding protein YgfZ
MSFYLHHSDLRATSAVIRISGPDANTYLQGQFTQDLRGPVGRVVYGLWLNQKGKVVADSQVLRWGENESLIVCFSTPADVLRERLESCLIADEVNLGDETAQWERIAAWTEKEGALTVPGLEWPPAGHYGRLTAGVLVFEGRLPGAAHFEMLLPVGAAGVMQESLRAAGAQPADDATLARHRILAGIPVIPGDLGPGDLPHEGGLGETAISYTKGCFLGQEVMARLKNLGQVRRALHVVQGRGSPPAPGTSLFQAGRRVGEIRSAAPQGDGFVAMAMLSLVNYQPASRLGCELGAAPDIEVLRRV